MSYQRPIFIFVPLMESTRWVPPAQMAVDRPQAEAELLEDRKPLVYQGVQLVSTGSKHFTAEPVGAYLEV